MRPLRQVMAGVFVVASALAASPSYSAVADASAPAARPACTISGTSDSDVLRGTTGRDVICGLGGNDLIYGSNGFDVLIGGTGDDQLFGGPGNDTMYGDDGFDGFWGANGNDLMYGGPGGDYFNATRGSGPGGADGSDVMSGGADSDTARYVRRLTGVTVTLDGVANDGASGENDQAGVPTATAASDVENIDGGDGNDLLVGTDGPNFLVSRGGADTMRGLAGDDTIDTLDNVGGDTVVAGAGSGDYCASDAADTLTGCETIFP